MIPAYTNLLQPHVASCFNFSLSALSSSPTFFTAASSTAPVGLLVALQLAKRFGRLGWLGFYKFWLTKSPSGLQPAGEGVAAAAWPGHDGVYLGDAYDISPVNHPSVTDQLPLRPVKTQDIFLPSGSWSGSNLYMLYFPLQLVLPGASNTNKNKRKSISNNGKQKSQKYIYIYIHTLVLYYSSTKRNLHWH